MSGLTKFGRMDLDLNKRLSLLEEYKNELNLKEDISPEERVVSIANIMSLEGEILKLLLSYSLKANLDENSFKKIADEKFKLNIDLELDKDEVVFDHVFKDLIKLREL